MLLAISIFTQVRITEPAYNLNINSPSPNLLQEVSSIRQQQILSPVVKLSTILPINVQDGNGDVGTLLGSATGFSIKYDPSLNQSYIITNDHFCSDIINDPILFLIVENSSKPRIEPPEDFSMGHVVYSDPGKDLCLVITSGFIQPASLAGKDYIAKPMESITIVGGPSGTFPIIIDSYVSGHLDRSEILLGELAEGSNSFLFISGLIYPGHSGSPVYNKNGQVIGIVFAALPSYGCIAIQISDLYEFLNEVQ